MMLAKLTSERWKSTPTMLRRITVWEWCLRKMTIPERAFDSLQKALNLRPVYPEALNNLGILYLRTHRRDRSRGKF